MGGRVRPDVRRSPTAGLRRFLVAACLIAALPVAWRVGAAAADLRQAMAAYQLGVALQQEHRFDEAAVAFRNTIALYPRMLEAHSRLAEVEVRRGRIDEAIAVYRGILAVYPYSHLPNLHREVGLIELSDGRLEDARTDLLHAVALDPLDWRAHQLLGQAYRRLGDAKQAAASLRRAHELKQARQSSP